MNDYGFSDGGELAPDLFSGFPRLGSLTCAPLVLQEEKLPNRFPPLASDRRPDRPPLPTRLQALIVDQNQDSGAEHNSGMEQVLFSKRLD